MRAVTAEEPGQRAGTKPAEDLEDRLPETLQGRGGGRAKRRTTIGFSAKPDLSTIEPANGRAAHSRDRRDPGDQPAKDLQEEMLGALLLGLGEGEAPSDEGADSSMGSFV